MNMPVFKPSHGDSLVVRSTLGFVPEHNSKTANLPMTRKDFAGHRPNTGANTRFGQLSQSSFFARHNPQSNRVRHIKGLLDFPICAVHDDGYIANPRLSLRRPATQDDSALRSSWPLNASPRLPVQAINYHPNHINPALQNHKINFLDATKMYRRFPLSMKERADPKFGLIPVTDSWRDELRQLTERAGLGLPTEIKQAQQEQPKRTSVYSAETGRLIPPPSRALSRGYARQKQMEQEMMYHIAANGSNEALVLEMLCQILQTDSINAVQSWLVSAGQREKDLVLDMICSAVTNEADYWQRKAVPDFYEANHPRRPHTRPPSNMNVHNGYAAVDCPSPKLPAKDSNTLLMSEMDRKLIASAGNAQEKTIFDVEDHPALRPRSHKPDVFKVEHPSPRPSTKNGHPAKLPPLSPKSEAQLNESQKENNADSWKPDDAVV